MGLTKGTPNTNIRVVFWENDKSIMDISLNSTQVAALLGSKHVEIGDSKSSDKIDKTVFQLDANGVSCLQVYLK